MSLTSKPLPKLIVRPATLEDATTLQSILGSCITWLADKKGTPEQWSRSNEFIGHKYGSPEHVRIMLDGGGVFVVQLPSDSLEGDQKVAATFSLTSERPSYVDPLIVEGEDPSSELFIKAMAVHRYFSGMKIGEAIIQLAKEEAKKQGKKYLYVDCFRSDEAEGGDLVRYYERVGFRKIRPFQISPEMIAGEVYSWPGMLMQMVV